jgi:hypothetical protein
MDKYWAFERVREVNELTGGFFFQLYCLEHGIQVRDNELSRWGVNTIDLSSNFSRVS